MNNPIPTIRYRRPWHRYAGRTTDGAALLTIRAGLSLGIAIVAEFTASPHNTIPTDRILAGIGACIGIHRIAVVAGLATAGIGLSVTTIAGGT